ncbi:putative cystine transporter YijE [bacterium HR36]|nr:putative cystine transporter YijE [bacterium HR36]
MTIHLPARWQGRLLILVASVLWSLSGVFVRLLRHPVGGPFAEPPLPPLVIAFYRCLFAALVLAPTLRRQDFSFHRLMIAMIISFAAMNALFVSALSLGSAANAIILQYTAPFWLYVLAIFWLRDPIAGRDVFALAIALTGIGLIVITGFRNPDLDAQGLVAIFVALASGLAYAGVVFCLRVLAGHSSQWLTWLNHAAAAFSLLPIIGLYIQPHLRQLLLLLAFGAIQMALPYWLVSRGLRTVPAQEAGMLSLIEPILNPLWVFFLTNEMPSPGTILGGSLILLALVWRFWPAS